MEQAAQTNASSLRFFVSVVAVCVVVSVVITKFATGGSTAPDQQALTQVELRALAQQATLRVSASACGRAVRGSGVIIDGRLVTNAHVVDGASEMKADQPIDPIVVPVVSIDRSTDLAAAEQPPGVSLLLASAPDVDAVGAPGQQVILAGHADGGSIEIQSGVITARVPGGAYGYGSDVVLIDAPTRGGYSGGPVLDEAGNVVAILSGFDRTTGLTVAIPADVVADFLDSTESQAPRDLISDCSIG